MPKTSKNIKVKLEEWVGKSDRSVYEELKDNFVFCKACGKTFKCEKKSHFEQHIKGEAHKTKMLSPLRQTTILQASSSKTIDRSFNMDLCEALIAADIPWNKLNNPIFNNFLKTYCQRKIPDESTLRKNYLVECYNETIESIRNKIGDSNIWISTDETTDSMGRYMANLIIGKMIDTEPGVPYLLATKQLNKTTAVNVCRFINESLGILWPNGIKYERVKLFLSDGAAYMVKCGRDLKIFYPDVIHLTCLAHALNLVSETVRNNFEQVDGLIASVKKVFLKAPLRIEYYKEHLPDLPLPPQPVLTRWGTWLEAAIFYADHFDEIKPVVLAFESTDAVCIERAQNCFKQNGIKNDLLYIKSHFKILITSIKKLEAIGLQLTDSLKVLDDVKETLSSANGQVAKKVLQKFNSLLEKNPGYEMLNTIRKLLNGETDLEMNLDWSNYKFAPITSCDVERSFSWLKNILSDKRTSFAMDNFEKYLVCHAYRRQ